MSARSPDAPGWLHGLYSWLMRAAAPLLRAKLRRRGRVEPGYLDDVQERFGRYAHASAGAAVWIHAVSLGETRAAAALVAQLRLLRPGLRLLLTHGTATGRAEGRRLLGAGDEQAWLPWDTPEASARFLAHFRPRVGVLVETEVWPNLTQACRAAGVPLLLVNARMSERSWHRLRRAAPLMGPAYAGLHAVLAQTPADAERLAALGAPVQGAHGNLKFDVQVEPALLAQGRDWHARMDRPVVMIASSREGEEAAWLAALQRWRGPRPRWLVVPRHPQRFDAVEALLAQAGMTVCRRSAWPAEGPPREAGEGASDEVVWLGDSLGEMPLYYAMADLALLGGSFEPLGGQNLIEAAACACPVLMGPHTFNFAEAARMALHTGAAREAASMPHALELAQAWLADPPALAQARRACADLLRLGAGTAQLTAQAVLAAMDARAPADG